MPSVNKNKLRVELKQIIRIGSLIMTITHLCTVVQRRRDKKDKEYAHLSEKKQW